MKYWIVSLSFLLLATQAFTQAARFEKPPSFDFDAVEIELLSNYVNSPAIETAPFISAG